MSTTIQTNETVTFLHKGAQFTGYVAQVKNEEILVLVPRARRGYPPFAELWIKTTDDQRKITKI